MPPLDTKPPSNRHAVHLIVVAQLFGTSLWFSANSAADPLRAAWGLSLADIGALTNAVQLGFIAGTLLFALTGLADRFAASRLFAACAALGALLNAAFAGLAQDLSQGLALRFAVGLMLAGVYPVGMKLVVGWAPQRAGQTLAWLVGMLTLGTALPHGLRALGSHWPWQATILASSALALVSAAAVLRLGDGPHAAAAPGAAAGPALRGALTHFRIPAFSASALGYFGHMWELYAFWAFVPVILANYSAAFPQVSINISWWSFLIIGIGGLACVLGGYWAQRRGTRKTAATLLLLSGCCCLVSPWVFALNSIFVVLGFLLFWGMVVVADSPLFSTLVAQNAAAEVKGTALTIVNCIGFSITIISIQLLNMLSTSVDPRFLYVVLALGPVLGLVALSGRKAG